MKVAVVGHLKFPISRPFAGGLESFTDSFVRSLKSRGHDVTLFASADSDPTLPLSSIIDHATIPQSKRKFGREVHDWIEDVEDESYASLMTRLIDSDFDIVHNHSLSPIPLQFASLLPCPMVTTLHAPCLPRIENELLTNPHRDAGCFVNISRANAANWKHAVGRQRIIHNGVDTDFWSSCGCERVERAIWFGRILPDKGTHFAIDAAHEAGLSIDLVGPVSHDDYFQSEVCPRLRENDVYHGHRSHDDLCGLIGRAAVAIVTPCWDEPFGLVVAESLACGTPVAAFSRGAMPELIRPSVGRLAQPGNVGSLAVAISESLGLNGEVCRRYAQEHFSFDRMMLDYERLYAELVYTPSPESIRLRVAAPSSTPVPFGQLRNVRLAS